MAVGAYGLRAQRNSVEEQLDCVAIAVNPHRNFLALAAQPIPMRKEVQHWTVAPPALIIVAGVLGKAARVEDCVLRTDRGPREWSRLAPIIKTTPHEAA